MLTRVFGPTYAHRSSGAMATTIAKSPIRSHFPVEPVAPTLSPSTTDAPMKPLFLSHWLLLLAFSLPVFYLPGTVAGQVADLEQGRQLFESQCGSCHGPLGNGGKGANLAQPQLQRATNDQALQNIIRRGISGTEMPGSFLTPVQVSSIAAYVKTLGRVAPEQIPGSAGSGEALYASLDCVVCHTLGGEGGILGPRLDGIGATRSAAHIRESLMEPSASVPNGFLLLLAVTEDGRSVPGVRINEDAFSVQLRDFSNNLLSFWKDELQSLEKQWGISPMLSYEERLTREQTDDLVAYLVSLKGGS